jgi:short-subunit dehydrogenase
MRKILLLGGTSMIGESIMSSLLQEEDDLIITGRSLSTLEPVAADLKIRHRCTVKFLAYDMCSAQECEKIGNKIVESWGIPDIIIAATGALGDQGIVRDDVKLSYQVAMSNYLGITSTLTPMIGPLEQRGCGHIVVLSSVAGDRGRQSNYVYGAAKSAVNTYLSGLRSRLRVSGVKVTTVKLGFVDTPMIAGKEGAFLVAKPEWVGRKIVALINRPTDVVYLPGFWWLIMLIIKHIPEMIFKRLKI